MAQFGSASGLGPEGRRFKSCHPDHLQGSIAQLGEHLPYKQRVTGSSPVTPTIKTKYAGVAQLAEQLICNQQVAGSSPITSSNMGRFPSGQRGQTVNLLLIASVVRIHPLPPEKRHPTGCLFSTK